VKHPGHTFGGIYTLSFPNLPPKHKNNDLEEYVMLPTAVSVSGWAGEEPTALQLYDEDPLATRTIQPWLQTSLKERSDSGLSCNANCTTYSSIPSPPSTYTTDPFARLPNELHAQILSSLPTPAAFSLQRASPVFAVAGALSQQFWASRFGPGMEFEYVFEALEPMEEGSQWRDFEALYAMVKGGAGGKAMRSRRRVWRLVAGIAGVLARDGV
jgi:hypothetical protein